MFIRFSDAWDEEDEDEQEEESEVAEVAVTGKGLNLRQRVQADLLHWVHNNMLL
jgi:Flp pilus assembly protein CpaB